MGFWLTGQATALAARPVRGGATDGWRDAAGSGIVAAEFE